MTEGTIDDLDEGEPNTCRICERAFTNRDDGDCAPGEGTCDPCAQTLMVDLEEQVADHRAALVRVVVAQQWAVAILTCAHEYGVSIDGWERAYDQVSEDIAQYMDCAADVIADLLGEPGELVARGGA